ncbi:MAG: tyrosine-type recombinase/integrase [Candidatus Electronema sp. V4]|uniref:tyrosine-type recombinase/integrase n=1 Tax=Candidatus Electronema sp. V4 TaxID=3454756 RepID=UPI00405537D6
MSSRKRSRQRRRTALRRWPANGWSGSHAKAVRWELEHDAFPFFGGCPADAVTPPMVLEAVRSIEERGALEMARKALQRINAVFRYAVQTGKATYNPAADMRGALKSRKVIHRAALSGDELPEFMQALMRADIDTATKLALQFTILTAARSGETRGGRHGRRSALTRPCGAYPAQE